MQTATLQHTRAVTCVEEQAWNEAQLSSRVVQPQFHVWRYRSPGVVLGRRQHALVSQGKAACRDVPVVVRSAGGGAVLTGPWMLSASVVLPPDHYLLGNSLVASYRWLGILHAGLLRDLGIDAHAVPSAALREASVTRSLSWACFGSLSPWEVVVGKRKIVGLAQIRRRHGVLLTSGTLISPPEWPLLCHALGEPDVDARLLSELTTSCAEHTTMPLLAESLAEHLSLAIQDLLGLGRVSF